MNGLRVKVGVLQVVRKFLSFSKYLHIFKLIQAFKQESSIDPILIHPIADFWIFRDGKKVFKQTEASKFIFVLFFSGFLYVTWNTLVLLNKLLLIIFKTIFPTFVVQCEFFYLCSFLFYLVLKITSYVWKLETFLFSPIFQI